MTIATHPSALGRAAGAATPADHVIVLFGATGDLAKRKLLPAQTILLQESAKSCEPKGEQTGRDEPHRLSQQGPASLRLSGAEYVEVLETICNSLAEGEDVALDARLEKGDLEGSVCDRSRLPDQLIQPLVLFLAARRRVTGRSGADEARAEAERHQD
jgi:hypothetical protein